jgi:UDP:flavonoid glycosyltransferase YjiC (YdhE family)
VRFDRTDATQLGRAIDALLTEPAYRNGASRIEESFRTAGGVSEAADRLAALAG